MLCNGCGNRLKVESTETGVMFDRCDELKVDIRTLGNVRACTQYYSKDLPLLFHRDAWVMYKDDNGDWQFRNPNAG